MGMSLGFNKCILTRSNEPAQRPNLSKWDILEIVHFDNGTVIKVKYQDFDNFDGVKILVYRGQYEPKIYLDPHFSENHSPIARFRPDEEGWNFALEMAIKL